MDDAKTFPIEISGYGQATVTVSIDRSVQPPAPLLSWERWREEIGAIVLDAAFRREGA